jgi:hypothetical protein
VTDKQIPALAYWAKEDPALHPNTATAYLQSASVQIEAILKIFHIELYFFD